MRKGRETMLKVPDVAERLDVLTSTVRIWCRAGRFPNAVQEETLRGPVWLIPESDLKGFEKRGRGRPPKPSSNGAATPRRALKKGVKR